MNRLRAQVLAGIAAGEVRRVKVGNTYRIEWFKPDGHELGWGRTHGKIFTRWPTHTVNQLIEAGLAAESAGKIRLTRAGKALLKAAE